MIDLDNVILENEASLLLSDGTKAPIHVGSGFNYRLDNDIRVMRILDVSHSLTGIYIKFRQVSVYESTPPPFRYRLSEMQDAINSGRWANFKIAPGIGHTI